MEKDKHVLFVEKRLEGHIPQCLSWWSVRDSKVANDLSFALTSVSLIFCIELFLNFIVRKETKKCLKRLVLPSQDRSHSPLLSICFRVALAQASRLSLGHCTSVLLLGFPTKGSHPLALLRSLWDCPRVHRVLGASGNPVAPDPPPPPALSLFSFSLPHYLHPTEPLQHQPYRPGPLSSPRPRNIQPPISPVSTCLKSAYLSRPASSRKPSYIIIFPTLQAMVTSCLLIQWFLEDAASPFGHLHVRQGLIRSGRGRVVPGAYTVRAPWKSVEFSGPSVASAHHVMQITVNSAMLRNYAWNTCDFLAGRNLLNYTVHINDHIGDRVA